MSESTARTTTHATHHFEVVRVSERLPDSLYRPAPSWMLHGNVVRLRYMAPGQALLQSVAGGSSDPLTPTLGSD